MKSLAVLVGVLLPVVAPAAENQSSAPDAAVEAPTAADAPNDYGTTSRSLLALTAWNAVPIDNTTYATVSTPGGSGIHRTGGFQFFNIPIQLPTGVVVSEVELCYCDTGASNFIARWARHVKGGPGVPQIDLHSSSGTPGCVVVNAPLTPQTIDNNANSYSIGLVLLDANIVFLSARVAYRLQISPAPAVATFPNDVPTGHPQFRFVEALAASGVTGGCGPGSYCPDANLTRGQMAVFLATALGLHFPN